MEVHFRALSISYKDAPVEVREQVALSEEQSRAILRSMKELAQAEDVLILSTCNRTEIYYSANQDLSDKIAKILYLHTRFENKPETLSGYFRKINSTEESITHLFRVALGLESHVVGDLQITGQVKKAYQLSADEDMAGPFLHRLLHTIFYANKRTTLETAFRDGAASVSYAAVETVYRLTQALHQPTILVIGLGDIGSDVVRNFADSSRNNNKVTITNRSADKAEKLASETGFDTLPFEQAQEVIDQFDVIITATSGESPLFNRKKLLTKNILTHKFFVDLSVPRAVDPDVEGVPGVLLYNIDQIQEITSETLQKRKRAIPEVEKIVSETVNDFQSWTKEMEVSPTIRKIKSALEQIRKEEVAKNLKDLDLKEAETVERITKGIVQKIVKLPALHLKAACKRGEAENLITVLNDLFDLEKQPQVKK